MPVTTTGPLHNTYDYIITGAGCAGLSLVMHLIDSGAFTDKKILLVDKNAKQTNDRTWCFWEREAGLFQSIVKKEWREVLLQAPGFSRKLDIRPYTYKLIRGIDFYDFCLARISKEPNIHFLTTAVTEIFSDATRGTGVVLEDGTQRQAQYIF